MRGRTIEIALGISAFMRKTNKKDLKKKVNIIESTNFAPIPYTRKTKHDYALVIVPYSKCILAQIRVKLWTTVGTVKHFTTFACFRHEAKKRSQGLLGKMTNKKVFLVPRKWFAPGVFNQGLFSVP